jgi:hypothetical protein
LYLGRKSKSSIIPPEAIVFISFMICPWEMGYGREKNRGKGIAVGFTHPISLLAQFHAFQVLQWTSPSMQM